MKEEQLVILLDYIDAAIESMMSDVIEFDSDILNLNESHKKTRLRQVAIDAICFDEYEEDE